MGDLGPAVEAIDAPAGPVIAGEDRGNDGAAASADAEAAEDAGGVFPGDEVDHRSAVRMGGGAAGDAGSGDVAGVAVQNEVAGDSDRLAAEVDLLRISAVGHQHGITGAGGIDPGLDGGLISRHRDDVGQGGNAQERRQENDGHKKFHGLPRVNLLKDKG